MKFTSPLGPDELVIETLEGTEGISRLFEFQGELLADAGTEIELSAIMGQKVTVEISLVETQGSRYINGMVNGFVQMGGDTDFDVYHVHIVPSLWQLTLATNCRVFQGKTVMDIIKAVITPYGLSVGDKTEGTLQALDYCTQYNETDFNFISRLAEQHGIFYWFEHSDSDNKVNFGNSRTAYADCPLVNTVTYSPNSDVSQDRYVSSIQNFSSTATMVTGRHITGDYDYRTFDPNKVDGVPTTSTFANNTFSNYYWPGGEEGYVKLETKQLSTPQHAKGFLANRAGASDLEAEVLHGVSSARTMTSGYTFTMTDHTNDAWNRKYLLTEISHQVDQIPSYRSTTGGDDGEYRNRFTAVSSDLVFRPRLVTPKPLIHGPQTAFVVTAKGEDIHIDKLGRVCVQFWWDYQRPDGNTIDNTWVRVAQSWAGNGWGTYFWPRTEDEVIVQFLNGDPDNPIIVGSVYNGTNVPKYALPDMSTRSGILTRSSQGGGAANANELRFEDKMGSEQIFINAEHDMDHRIENDHREYVKNLKSVMVDGSHYDQTGGDRHSTLNANKVEKIKEKMSLDVGTDRNEKVGGNVSLQVGTNMAEKVGMNYSMDAGMEVYIKAGMTLVIESGMELCLKGAGGFITIGPAGIAISGTMVMINSGGAAVSGTAGTIVDPDPPTAPDQADDGTKGGKM
ncbi:type VI secretion system Vgr family protein [Granulicella tundricola]|uniref:Type VI secretion system Vgr family protein n=1 Tax=Granulicella tundricola (strain ATCC BAA-1859 / DSM 23138 / MP5ACTX9) TaxID=1198114 RepID=E8X5Q8_GRATM|nr:type VI secretion system tip protein TssI/VgrG [Granulicella tundricola]ADW70792.1 type VI secretion system Vgr family protein [Granulicella tundricola MP5ACTX9]